MGNSADEGSATKSPVDMANDAEGVWSPDIEQSFQEALAIYPPCGRRKIILSDEGKMYGRNELIARYIKLRTGKTRTRKQVSSHIQVLARKKAREIQGKLKDQAARDKALQTMASMSSAQIVSASVLHSKALAAAGMPAFNNDNQGYHGQQQYWPSGTGQPVQGSFNSASQSPYGSPSVQATVPGSVVSTASVASPTGAAVSSPEDMRSASYSSGTVSSTPPTFAAHGSSSWPPRSVEHQLPLRLVEFSAFLEQQRMDPESYHKHLFVHLGPNTDLGDPHLEAVDIRQIYDKFPEKKGGLKELYDKGPQPVFFLVKFWADLNTNIHDEAGAFYGVSSTYESNENMTITCSTKVCSFGKQVVEKVETEFGHYENSRFVYRIHRSPMCEYMINFVHKLKQLPEKYMMNSVLENFTILQVLSNRETQETLLCLAYVFEVSTSEHGAQHHIYRLVKD
ncbi:transcriptional enhancer factor TEF-1-like isoform X1 [Orbicella faveolata]|uniref:transcriptional enhancer factor TEF-1-like isoform X1 n=1 Tax=Orbicella faveolata TaxID=48498 RepID=UPI0009E3B92D|nr:transcriptional enhancer factor TEF-1-like isoform X1 [Orbicella faveolata]XP_020619316.1 transcriptional enhancer factor TEF-1-like isoform X1 [Orbicella faveolata]XP_020619317.1 transcriptional enhancer factor TEF-1-like isoform X1 [Orbicella faveolata]XP_020619318.1 transcriptional enhancer factor TEF-1-like isoform X1 [Orbicella faveolata]